ncbi:cytoplasmic protein [Colwellia sp. 20A7]|jgi:hypothetical protein|uniref:cytoplasmic protein n=1 Tax=Colwellia sp. 20A7 TaxID=2689569 RepID=UPI001359410C|nr:cytoplasmic protein [Colwellia sp. 20A7]
MSINITNTPSFAPENGGNGTILSVAVKAKEIAEAEGEMALQLIQSAAPAASSSNTTASIGQNINIKA